MDVVILAGGFGSRLRGVINDIPKPMAPVNKRPFLEIVMERMVSGGASRFILSTGFRHDCIMEHFGNSWLDKPVIYSHETSPLGTGGAIAKACKLSNESLLAIANGDTFLDVDISAMMTWHKENYADVTIAVKELKNEERYGLVEMDTDWRIRRFKEKYPFSCGWINAGVYILSQNLFNDQSFPKHFSFEEQILSGEVTRLKLFGFPCHGKFIDIGVPEDYRKALEYFS